MGWFMLPETAGYTDSGPGSAYDIAIEYDLFDSLQLKLTLLFRKELHCLYTTGNPIKMPMIYVKALDVLALDFISTTWQAAVDGILRPSLILPIYD